MRNEASNQHNPSQFPTFQKHYYGLVHELLNTSKLNNFTYTTLRIIQTIQCIHFMLWGQHPWVDTLSKYIATAINYISIDYLIACKVSTYPILLIISLVFFLMLICALVLIAIYSQNRSNSQHPIKIFIPTVSFILILFRNVLQIPCIYLIGSSFNANIHTQPTNDVIIYILGLVNLIVFFTIQIFIYMSLIDPNPFSEVIFACQTKSKLLLNLISKTILTLYYISNPQNEYKVAYSILFIIVALLNIVYSHWQIGCEKDIFRKSQVKHQYIILWVGFYTLLNYIYPNSITPILHLPMVYSVSVFAANFIDQQMQQSLLRKKTIYMHNCKQISKHTLLLIKLVDSLQIRESKIAMEGYLAYHHRLCKIATCTCQTLINLKTRNKEDQKYLFNALIVSILNQTLIRFPQSKQIQILLSNLYQYRLKNRFRAIYSITNTLAKSDLQHKMYFYHQIHLIERGMVEVDDKQNINKAIDINGFLVFNNIIVRFQQLIYECVLDYIQFWRELLEVNIDLRRLQAYGAIITSKKDEVKMIFDQLTAINSNNAHVLTIYGQFLCEVISDETNYGKYIDKAKSILSNIKQSSKIDETNNKYTDNAQTSIVIVSGNKSDLGMMVHSNNFVKKSLGYKRSQLLNHNVSMIMPKIFGDYHNQVLTKYLSTSAERFNGKERVVPVLTKDGYMFPSIALTKPLPNLNSGIQIAGFISQIDEKFEEEENNRQYSYILYRTDNEMIMGISKKCYTLYGIPNCLVYGNHTNPLNQLKIQHIFGVSFERDSQISSKTNSHQLIVSLNTTNIRQQFIYNHEIDGQLNNEIENGVQCQVVIKCILSLVYNNIPLKIISLYKNQPPPSQVKQLVQQDIQRSKSLINKVENDDLKDLKDFKNFISIKSQPLAIRSIRYICLTLIIIFVIGISTLIAIIFTINGINHQMITVSQMNLINQITIPQLLYQHEKILLRPDYSENIVNKMNKILQISKKNQDQYFNNVYQTINNYQYQVNAYQMTNNSLIVKSTNIDQVLNNQICKFQAIITSSLNQLNSSTPNLINKLIIEARHDIVLSLLNNLITNIDSLSKILQNRRANYALVVYLGLGIMIGGILFWIVASVPYALSVSKINNRVLSLFSLIPHKEVCTIIRKSIQYIKCNLTQSDGIDDLEDIKLTQHENDMMYNNDHQTSNIMIKTPMGSPRAAINIQQKFNKMVNSQNTDKTKILSQYICIGLLMVGFVLWIHLYSGESISKITNQIQIHKYIGNRFILISNLKVVFTEYLAVGLLSNVSLQSMTYTAIDDIYKLQRVLLSLDYSDSYKSNVFSFNNGDICQSLNFNSNYSIILDALTSSQCQQLSDGILSKGVKTVVVTMLENIRAILAKPKSISMMSEVYKIHQLSKYIGTTVITIQQQIKQQINNVESKFKIAIIVGGCLFILLVLLAWRSLWIKYIKQLNQQIWRTKGMLNIIPMRIIVSNDVLKKQFTNGTLQEAVR